MVAITGVRLIDGTGAHPMSDMTVLVQNGRIHAVGSSKTTVVPKNAEVIDARGLTLVPGLMDSHFHLDSDGTLPALFLVSRSHVGSRPGRVDRSLRGRASIQGDSTAAVSGGSAH